MAKVITFSRYFPKGHPHAGRKTHFPEKIVRSLGYDLKSVISVMSEALLWSEIMKNDQSDL